MNSLFRNPTVNKILPALARLYSNYSTPKKHVNLEALTESRKAIHDQLTEAAQFSRNQWKDFANKLINREITLPGLHVNDDNVDGVILRLCSDFHLFDTGKNYFDMIKQNGTPISDVILSRYLNICSLNKQFAIENKSEIIGIYKRLSEAVMEPNIAERCISAICMYEEHWKESIELLESVRKVTEPTNATFFSIIEAAFAFNDSESGWKLLYDFSIRITSANIQPRPAVYIAYLDYCQRLQDAGRLTLEHIETFFKYIEEFALAIPSKAVVEKLEKLIFSLSDNEFVWSLKETYIPRIGVCSGCRRVLDPVKITKQEFEELRKAFIKKAVVGSNIFLKTTPEEILRYKNFLMKALPYDVVIDGLNVAYSRRSKDPRRMAKCLESVVAHFVKRNLKVLVLGRQHMKHWPRSSMDYLYKNTRVFLALNLSEDDPFLLYAALKGGESTCIISRDLMRSHIFALEDPKLKKLFRNWLVSHQYHLGHFNKFGDPTILTPPPYRPSAQKLSLEEPNLCWHLPYHDEYALSFPERVGPDQKWLCITRNSRN